MVAPAKTRRLVCTVVCVAETPPTNENRFVRKPSTLVPWADPYIAGLVRRLQSEVRRERAAVAAVGRPSPSHVAMFDSRGAASLVGGSIEADLDPPAPFGDDDWDWFDQPRWTVDGEPAAE